MTPKFRAARAALMMIAAALVAVVATGTGAAAPAFAEDPYVSISGTGSTWSQNALDQWRKNVASNYGMTVNYSGVGSSAGRQDFINGTVDFAVSEIPFQPAPEDGSPAETPPNGYAYMPIVAGGTSFMYNLKIGGKRVTNLRLSGENITKIFTGAITKWNDPALVADNPGLAMPDQGIVPVVRSDGSGSTAQFTLWMSKQYPALWSAYSGRTGLTSQYPATSTMKSQNGSLGVAGYVSQGYGEGSITYVEYSYAKNSGFPVAKVLNTAGYYVEPKATSVAVALLQAQINEQVGSPDYLTQILDGVYNNADARSYPLSSYSYMIVPTAVAGIFTEEKGRTLGAFARYMLCEGQQQADTLGYSPLPMNLVLAGSAQIARIPGAGSSGIDPNACNNPTFSPGDSPSSNQLAATAPQPAECDKQGPNQCTTGTGGAVEETPVTGTGSGGSSSDAPGAAGASAGAGAAAGATAGAAAAAGTAPVYDENGALISGGTAVAGAAVSSPFTLADSGMGPQQWLMVAAGVLLLVAVVVPPLVSRRLKHGGGS
ncbi:phosphate ABC transporter substrate-binding protein PstS [Herbiconiux liukaitaii]|uniref:phosphate ABC transporter substrate-binding protein PstS n=1 Tax=Herbiconiux liukaitaii TaxID=3342799 RepID=UPI0035B9CFD7